MKIGYIAVFHLTASRVQSPNEEGEAEDTTPLPHSGMERACSHLPAEPDGMGKLDCGGCSPDFVEHVHKAVKSGDCSVFGAEKDAIHAWHEWRTRSRIAQRSRFIRKHVAGVGIRMIPLRRHV